MAVKPISPDEVVSEKLKVLPDVVIEVVNGLIAQKWNGHSAKIKQEEIILALTERGLSRKDISKKNLLELEDVYRQQGWKVAYDRPGYCESYDPFFEFKKP